MMSLCLEAGLNITPAVMLFIIGAHEAERWGWGEQRVGPGWELAGCGGLWSLTGDSSGSCSPAADRMCALWAGTRTRLDPVLPEGGG